MKDENKEVLLDLKELGRITKEELSDVESSVTMISIDEAVDLNAYAVQSGCSACSASGLGSCC